MRINTGGTGEFCAVNTDFCSKKLDECPARTLCHGVVWFLLGCWFVELVRTVVDIKVIQVTAFCLLSFPPLIGLLRDGF